MALSGTVMGTSDKTKVRFFRAHETLKTFGTIDLSEIRRMVGISAAKLAKPPTRILVDRLPHGTLISWYWAR